MLVKQTPLLIVGLGASGMSVARLASTLLEYKPYLIEAKPQAELMSELVRELSDLQVQLACSAKNELPSEFTKIDFKLAVLSPGVPPGGALAQSLRRRGVELISELEFALRQRLSPTVIVTGSNGKSTVTSLIAHILRHAGRVAHACGNLGTATCEVLYTGVKPSDWLVIEASSYQLELTSTLGVELGVFVNLSENHLERHGDMSAYFEAKARLFYGDHSCARVAVINVDDEYGKKLAAGATGRVEQISDPVVCKGNLIGRHNSYNIALASAAAKAVGLGAAEINSALESFKPLEHRLERFSKHHIINDSKATTVAAANAGVAAVLEEFPDRRLCLLLGGKAKRGSWQPLFSYLQEQKGRLARLLCFGGDGRYLSEEASKFGIQSQTFETLHAATQALCQEFRSDEVGLLSPGCASFDQFNNFEERGCAFKALVEQLLISK